MIFSTWFSPQQSLCVSAMVCHQWCTASAHEDFWRSLSFEGGEITEEKCMHAYFHIFVEGASKLLMFLLHLNLLTLVSYYMWLDCSVHCFLAVAWLCCKYPKAVELSLREVPSCVDEMAREAMYSLQ